jgi:hypothetical protein
MAVVQVCTLAAAAAADTRKLMHGTLVHPNDLCGLNFGVQVYQVADDLSAFLSESNAAAVHVDSTREHLSLCMAGLPAARHDCRLSLGLSGQVACSTFVHVCCAMGICEVLRPSNCTVRVRSCHTLCQGATHFARPTCLHYCLDCRSLCTQYVTTTT